MNKLLTKQFRAFTVYALVVLACSIPAYFFIVDYIWLDELDEHNHIVAQKITAGFDSLEVNEQTLAELLDIWNKTQPGTNLVPVASQDVHTDSTYEIIRTIGNETDRFRGLSWYIHIHNKPYHLTVETNIEESKETIAAIAVITVLFFLVLVLGFIILNRKISSNVWKPFYHTLEQLKAFDLNTHEHLRLEPSTIREFQELNQALNKLIERNIFSYKEQKEFTENASHELQTPLAIMQSKLDLLLQHKELTQEQYESIEDINKTLTRISRINKNLLLLTKMENNNYAEVETISIKTIVSKQLEFFTEQASEKQITIETRYLSDVSVTANPGLTEILINNLILNAIRHNTTNGKLMISLEENKLMVTNTGDHQSLSNDKLFKRFSKASSGATGTGLGLAIVKKIADSYHWTISYGYSNSLHSFTVQF